MTDHKHGFPITTRDRLMLAWQSSMTLARDFGAFSDQEKGIPLQKLCAKFSEEEGIHAAKLRECLLTYEQKEKPPKMPDASHLVIGVG